MSESGLKALYATGFSLVIASKGKIPVIIDKELLYANYIISSNIATCFTYNLNNILGIIPGPSLLVLFNRLSIDNII